MHSSLCKDNSKLTQVLNKLFYWTILQSMVRNSFEFIISAAPASLNLLETNVNQYENSYEF